MCLVIGNNRSFVSDNDIVVYKYVTRTNNGYKTPYQHHPVKVNQMLTASENGEAIVREYCRKHQIEGGAIHSCVSSKDKNFSDNVCLKAVIPAGTEFWIQDDMKQIASRQLLITDEVVEDERHTDMSELFKFVYDNAPSNKDGIKVGDVLLSNGEVVSPLADFDKTKVIGYVGYIHPLTDKAVFIGLENDSLPFATDYNIRNSSHSDISSSEVENDFEGHKHTYDIANAEDYNSDIFKAIEYCRQYRTEGTNRGDWYLPAIGEAIALAKNIRYINASIEYLHIGDTLNFDWMWSSSQTGDGSYSWCCYLDDGDCGYYWYNRVCKRQVRPLFAFIKQA